MALYTYNCRDCATFKRVIKRPLEKLLIPSCPECGIIMKRLPSNVSVRVVETLDNGAMPKKVERLSEAERLFKERSQNGDKS